MSATIKPSSNSPPQAVLTGYQPPSTGIFTLMPPSWIPYAELMRLDRPAGYYAFYWHYAIGLGFAACISSLSPAPPPPFSRLLLLAAHLALWVLLLRGATCTWNDNLDQDYDRLVTRTRFRPIARGAVSTAQAHIFTLVQLVLGAVLLLALPRECATHAAAITAVLMVYPLGKRFTDFPQVILGVGFAMPVFLCCAAVGVRLHVLECGEFGPGFELLGGSASDAGPLAASCLFVASALWTIIFDTVYAHQDTKDDVKAGVRSLAVLLGDYTKLVLSVLAGVQVSLLLVIGVVCRFSAIYFLASCGGAAAVLATMLISVRLDRPESCAWWFGPGSKLVGASLVLGLWGQYLFAS